MKKYILPLLLLISAFSLSACSPQKGTDTAPKDQSKAVEQLPVAKTYKSNLYGFQFDAPAEYASNLESSGMENFSDGNEVYGVQIMVPYEGLAGQVKQFRVEILNPDEKKAYSDENVNELAATSFQTDKKNGNFTMPEKMDEILLAGKKAYQYKMTSATGGDLSELTIFVADGNTGYKIVLTDISVMREILASLKFKN